MLCRIILVSKVPSNEGQKGEKMKTRKRFSPRAITLIVICLSMALSLMVMPAEAKNKKKANDEVVVVSQTQARVHLSQVPKKFKKSAKKAVRIWRYTVFENKKAVATFYAFENRNEIIWLPDQYLEIEGSIGPRGVFLVGPETIEPEFYKIGVSLAMTPAGSAGAEVPGRGARDQFFFRYRKVGFHKWVENMKVTGKRNGRRSEFKISYRYGSNQALKLRKTKRKYNGHHILRLSYWN